LPGALWSHVIRNYQEYLRNISAVYPDQYYVNDFETINSTNTNDDGMMDDDAYINPPDDLLYEEDVVLEFDDDVVVVEQHVLVDVQ